MDHQIIEPMFDACEIYDSLHLSCKMQFGNTSARWRLLTNENKKSHPIVEYVNVREAYSIIKQLGKRNHNRFVDNIIIN